MALALFAGAIGYYALERGARDGRSENAIAANADQIFRSPAGVVAGNPQGDVSVVAFLRL